MRHLLGIVFITLGFTAPCSAKEVVGIHLTNSMEVNGQELTLNAAGLREKWGFDVYAADLYLTPSDSAESIINQDSTMAITLEMLRGVSSEDMASAIYLGFKNAMKGDTSALEEKINKFLNVFGTEATKGNIYQFIQAKYRSRRFYKWHKTKYHNWFSL